MTTYETLKDYKFDPTDAKFLFPNTDSIAVDKIKIYTDDSPSGYITIKPRKEVTVTGTKEIDGKQYPSETQDTEMYDVDDLPQEFHDLVDAINNNDVICEATVLKIHSDNGSTYVSIRPSDIDTVKAELKDEDEKEKQEDDEDDNVIL